jgi:hypothetical protein
MILLRKQCESPSKDWRENQDRCEDRGEVQSVEKREGFGVGWEVGFA